MERFKSFPKITKIKIKIKVKCRDKILYDLNLHTRVLSFLNYDLEDILGNKGNENRIQWNLDLTKSLGTGQICSLNGGFVISKTSI